MKDLIGKIARLEGAHEGVKEDCRELKESLRDLHSKVDNLTSRIDKAYGAAFAVVGFVTFLGGCVGSAVGKIYDKLIG